MFVRKVVPCFCVCMRVYVHLYVCVCVFVEACGGVCVRARACVLKTFLFFVTFSSFFFSPRSLLAHTPFPFLA